MSKLKQHIYEEPVAKIFVIKPTHLCTGSNFSTESLNDAVSLDGWDEE